MVTEDEVPEQACDSVPSRYFGSVMAQPSAEIHFPLGLPGYDSETCLIALEIADQRPLVYLQSKTNPDLCFLTLPVRTILKSCEIGPTDEERDTLLLGGSEELRFGQDLLALAILFPVDGTLRVNLSAPLMINPRKMIGLQRIPAAEASFQYFLLRETGDWVPSC